MSKDQVYYMHTASVHDGFMYTDPDWDRYKVGAVSSMYKVRVTRLDSAGHPSTAIAPGFEGEHVVIKE